MSADPLRICFVVPTLGAGGTERQLLYLLKGLSEGHDLITVCTRSGGQLIGDAPENSSAAIVAGALFSAWGLARPTSADGKHAMMITWSFFSESAALESRLEQRPRAP